MRTIIAAAMAAALFAGPAAAASDKEDVYAVLRRFIGAVDKGDMPTALGICAAQSSVIDEFPPYAWQGASGCADWATAFGDDSKKNGVTDASVLLGRPLHIDVAGDRAYAVVEANYTFKQHGKRTTERGAIWTVALQKVADAWRITAWSWARR